AANEIEMYANTTGKYLYPLRKFDTPFSQWAVFTEYSGYNLWALSCTGQLEYSLDKKFSLMLDYDLNAITAKLDKGFGINPGEERRSSFIYPFFKSGFRYSPIREFYFSVYVTNKAMNLDIGYPTLYLAKKPFVGVELNCRL
ncbi:MAG TPA: hypothetical protein VF476_10545, partial [Chitinophagaceae bacterium]